MSNRQLVVNRVKECMDIATTRWPMLNNYPMPVIRFAKRGKTAGTANVTKWELDFNEDLLNENVQDFVRSTVAHEVAHLVDHVVYAPNKTYTGFGKPKRRSSHGPTWKNVMLVLGVHPSRCHDYDVSNATVRQHTTVKYRCTACDKVLEMGIRRHNKMRTGRASYYHAGCGKAPLVYIG